ncbi:MAG: aminotransferase class V-fold PLP-dependent enzyme [Candidatus Parcubacteria bacterium]|nr:aminotransferase class V-fold PLP-dependent enzyme [Candidatus Parcubacteria bacterium]
MFWQKNKKARTYLDIAAGVSGNPSSPHEEGRRAKQMLEDARTDIARLVEVQSDDVIFTSGATEANALAILGVLKKGDHAFYLPSAHASIVENMKLASERGVEVGALPIKDGRVDCKKLKELLRPQTKLVAMDAVCGETGIIWNTREVKQTIGADVLLHVDASQAPLTEKMSRAHFDADMMVLDASKVGEVRGIGALIAHRTIPLTPLYRGGGQERGLRPGSEAPELAREFARALRSAALAREKFRASALPLRACLIEAVKKIPNIFFNESRTQAPNILNISLLGRDTDYLVALLDEAGFMVSTRSACETDSWTGSRAVLALTGDAEKARATLRISWGPDIRPNELAKFARELVKAAAFSAGGGSASGGIDNGSQG